MTREELSEKMKDLPNPSCVTDLIQQVWEIMNEENEVLTQRIKELEHNKSTVAYLGQITIEDMQKELDKYKEMVEDMKAKIYYNDNAILSNYLIYILNKHEIL